jgi:hypothetical protein
MIPTHRRRQVHCLNELRQTVAHAVLVVLLAPHCDKQRPPFRRSGVEQPEVPALHDLLQPAGGELSDLDELGRDEYDGPSAGGICACFGFPANEARVSSGHAVLRDVASELWTSE